MIRIRAPLLAGLATVLSAGAVHASSEVLNPTQHQQIDALFAEYMQPARPGCAVGVMRDGRVAHARGYGLADVERGVPITPATIFDIGSTSKQFAAAAVILLELDGKLSLSDDVRKYVPELPDYGKPITIDHLLRHTSGMRDYTALLSLAGLEVEQVAGDEQALAVIARQRQLNFPTGTRYEYSNSGFFLLSVIVERVSGKSLGEFASERIFQPLGMKGARFRDKHAEVLPGRALGYAADGEAPQGTTRFKNALSNWEQTGDGALHLSIEDLFRWDQNFYRPQVGGSALLERLAQPGTLENGEKITYARGLFVDEYRGVPRVHHAGNWVGYNAMFARFPQQQTSIGVLCNFEGAEASALSDKIADLVLADVLKSPAPASGKQTAPGKKNSSRLPPQRVVGNYFASQTETLLEVMEQEGALILKIGATPLPLTATGPRSFEVTGYPLHVEFQVSGKQPASELQLHIGGDDAMTATRFTPAAPDAEEMRDYVGTFYSPELDVTWPLVIDQGKLAVRDQRRKFETKIQPLTPAMKDAFGGEPGLLRFIRDASGKVTGFDLSASRMRGIRFDAVKASTSALRAEIRTTSYGVPHVLADDFEGVGFGLGYAFAQTGICDIAARWVTVNAMRSRYFGPDEPSTDAYPSGPEPFTNVQSDFFWKSVLDRDLVGKELRSPAPLGPTTEVRDLVRGYAAGYNHYLAETGVNNIHDARCRGAEWVKPITERDVYLRALHWSSFLSSGAFMQDFVRAAPPTAAAKNKRSQPRTRAKDLESSITSQSQGPGSNMIALGKDATDNGRGMLFANPHWVWHGPERWFEAQLTVPGKLNVYGGGVLGVPVMLFGHNENVAWSHTLATPRRFTIYQLKLAPRSATTYLYDGKPRSMTPRTVTVDVRRADGKIEQRSHTFWETHYGTVMHSGEFGWTRETAYAVRDVAMNFRWLNQQLAMNRAQSVEQVDEAGRKYLGIGWLNTMAADSAGNVYFADRTGVPHVTDAQLGKCVNSDLGRKMLSERRQMVLDGSRSQCEWGSDADSIVPGTFGVAALPSLRRTDYVTNMNDSYWTNNPHQLLEGYPLIMGDERTPRSLRTRIGLLKIERRLDGSDGHPGRKFTLDQLEAITMDNRVLSAELWRDSLVSLCRKMPAGAGLPAACDVLAKWDQTENLDSPGAVLWRRFFENLDYKAQKEVFAVPFDSKDPINTPSGLNTADPRVAKALNTAISDLLDSGVPLDATYRDYQYDTRGDVRIPMHGGLADAGQYNFMHNKTGWVPGKGWPEMYLGSTLILWTQFTDQGPKGRSIMTYSQSDNPSSRYYLDQVKLFSEKQSKPIAFQEHEILADPNLEVTRVCAPAGSFECAGWGAGEG